MSRMLRKNRDLTQMNPIVRGVIAGMGELIVGNAKSIDTDLEILNTMSKMLDQPERIKIYKSSGD